MENIVYENGVRKAIIVKGENLTEGKFFVYYYFNGELDYEAIRGSGGLPCKMCETLNMAKGRARYYINKD